MVHIKNILKKKKNVGCHTFPGQCFRRHKDIKVFLISVEHSRISELYPCHKGLPWWLSKESTFNAGDRGLIPGSGRSPEEGNGNPLQYSCPGNPMDRGAWWATAHRVERVRHDFVTKPPPS